MGTLLTSISSIIGEVPPVLLQAAGYRVHDHNGQCSVRLKTGDVWILNPPRRDLKSVLSCDCDEFVDFVSMLLQWDSALRPTALQALQHPFLLHAEECGDYEGVICLVCCDCFERYSIPEGVVRFLKGSD